MYIHSCKKTSTVFPCTNTFKNAFCYAHQFPFPFYPIYTLPF